MEEKKYFTLKDLDTYKYSRKLSKIGWEIYESLKWQEKKLIGDQFITSVDSVGANVAEGYGRFHYLDKVRFYYNARGSLLESNHWFELLVERGFINNRMQERFTKTYNNLRPRLNGLIKSTRNAKKSKSKES